MTPHPTRWILAGLLGWGLLGPGVGLAAPELPHTLGEQRVLVILLRFPGSPESQTPAVVRAHFAAADAWVREVSYGQTWLTTEVVGWYPVAVTLPVCTITAVAQHGDAAATAAGITLADWPRRFYVFSHVNLECPCTAGSLVGAVPSRAFTRGAVSLYTIMHELGHSLGLRHSHAWDCSEGPLTGSCVSDEYGDRYDVMGWGAVHHYNAYQKQRLGWLDTDATPTILRPTGPGVYTIHPYALAASGPVKALQYGVFYVEYRTRAGSDAGADGASGLTRDGVLVHWVTGENQAYLVNPRPAQASPDFWLNVGEEIVDPSHPNVKLITRAVTPTEAQVELVIGPELPQPPFGLGVASTPTALELTWMPGGSPTGFTIERNVDGLGPFVPIAAVSEAFYVDATGLPGTTYCYRVFAVDAVGTSFPSEVACGAVPGVPGGQVAEQTFTRLSGKNETFPVPVGAYTCVRLTGGTNSLRILQGTTVRASIKPATKNPPVCTHFTLRCEVTATEVRASLDGVLRLTWTRKD